MIKLPDSAKKAITWTAIVFLVGGFLRASKVLSYQQPVFADEAIYVRWAQVMRAEPGLRFLPLSDGKQPLFMWSAIPLLKIFDDPLIAGRLLSVAAGLGTLLGVFILSFLFFKSKRVALISALIYALSPFAVFFDSMALVDSMLTFFSVWVLLFGVLTAKTLRLDYSMLAGFALGGALLTKSPAIYFLIFYPLTFIAAKWPENKKEKIIHLRKLVMFLIPSFLIAFGMYNIMRLGPNFHMLSIRNSDYVFPLSHILEKPFDPLLPFLHRSLEWLWIWGPSTLILLVFLGLWEGKRKFFREVVLLSAWAFFPLLISSEFAKVFTARYILFILPPLAILAGLAFFGKKYTLFKKLFLGVFIIHALFINIKFITDIEKAPIPRSERSGYLEEWTAGYGIKEVSELVREYRKENPGEKIVVGTEGYFGTLPDGLQMYLNDSPEITVIGVGVDLESVPKSLLESKKAGNKTFLVINNSRLKKSPDSLGLKIIAAYPKAFRKEGTREYNLYGPRENLYFLEVTDAGVN